jgi:hypothetical protein
MVRWSGYLYVGRFIDIVITDFHLIPMIHSMFPGRQAYAAAGPCSTDHFVGCVPQRVFSKVGKVIAMPAPLRRTLPETALRATLSQYFDGLPLTMAISYRGACILIQSAFSPCNCFYLHPPSRVPFPGKEAAGENCYDNR